MNRAAGLAVAALLAAASALIAWQYDLAAAPIVAIVLGIALASRVRRPVHRPGLAFASRTVLQGAVVLLGLLLSATAVLDAGLASLPVLASSALIVIVGVLVLARLMRIPSRLATLIAIGTGICGASAIAAAAAVLEPDEDEMGYAISTIFVCNVLAVITFVPVAHALGMSQDAFGMWAGTAINDTSSVVAAATAYGTAALSVAVVVKLVRVLAIVPVTIVLAARTPASAEPGRRASVPPFVIWFAAAVALRSFGLIPDAADDAIRTLALAATTIAMAAIGLSTDLAGLRRTGPRPFVFGMLLWLLLGTTALAIVQLVA